MVRRCGPLETLTEDGDGEGVWALRDGPSDPAQWLQDVYADATLVTRVGALHADHAEAGQMLVRGRERRPTSSSRVRRRPTTTISGSSCGAPPRF